MTTTRIAAENLALEQDLRTVVEEAGLELAIDLDHAGRFKITTTDLEQLVGEVSIRDATFRASILVHTPPLLVPIQIISITGLREALAAWEELDEGTTQEGN